MVTESWFLDYYLFNYNMTVCYQLIFGWMWPLFTMGMSFLGFWAAELSTNIFWEFIAAGKLYIFSWHAQTTDITHVDKSRFTRACLSLLRWDRTHGFRMRKGWLDIWQIVPRAPGPPDTHMTYIVCVVSALERQGVCWGEAHSAHTVGGRKRAVTGLTAAGLFSFPWSSAVRLIVSALLSVCVRKRYQQPFLARGLFAQWFMTKVTVASPHNTSLPSSQATGSSPLSFSLSWEIPNEFLRPEIWLNLRLLW